MRISDWSSDVCSSDLALTKGANQAVALTAGGTLDLGVASIDTGTADLALQSGDLLAMTTDLSGANVTLRGDQGIELGGDVTATGDLSLASRDAAIVQTDRKSTRLNPSH